jgi:hypothetical protein
MSLDVSTVCNVLNGLGYVDVDNDITSTVSSNKELSDRRKEFLSHDVDITESPDNPNVSLKRSRSNSESKSASSSSGHVNVNGGTSDGLGQDSLIAEPKQRSRSMSDGSCSMVDISGAGLLKDELRLIQDGADNHLYRYICTHWKSRLESYFESARVLHKLSVVAAANRAAEVAAAAAAAAAAASCTTVAAKPSAPTEQRIHGQGLPFNPISGANCSVPVADATVPGVHNRYNGISPATLPPPLITSDSYLVAGNGVMLPPQHSIGHSFPRLDPAMSPFGVKNLDFDAATAKLLSRQAVDDEHFRTHGQSLALFSHYHLNANPQPTQPSPHVTQTGMQSPLAIQPVPQKEPQSVQDVSTPVESSGPKVVKRASNQRAWKLSVPIESTEPFECPDKMLSRWASACYDEAVAQEIEEAIIRHLAVQCGVSLNKVPCRRGTSYLTQHRDTLETRSDDFPVHAPEVTVPPPPPVRVAVATNLKEGALYTAAMLWDKARKARNKLKKRSFSSDVSASSSHQTSADDFGGKSNKRSASMGSFQPVSPTGGLAITPQAARRFSLPLQLRSDFALIDPTPFAKTIFAPNPIANVSAAPVNPHAASFVMPDLVVKTAPIPWRQVAAEFQPLDNEDAENPLFALSFSPKENARFESKSFRRQSSSSSISSCVDDPVLQSPHTPVAYNSPMSQTSSRKSTSFSGAIDKKGRSTDGIASSSASTGKNSGKGLTRSGSSGSVSSSRDKKVPLVLAPTCRVVCALRNAFAIAVL